MPIRGAFPSLLLGLALVACKPEAPPPVAVDLPVDSTAVKAGVADYWQRWTAAEISGNTAAMAEMVDDSVRIDNKGSAPILGKAQWQSFAESMLKGVDVLTETITPDITIAASNELAYQNGGYVETAMSNKKKTTDYGRYAAAIRKGSDGRWRIRYIMAFSDSSVAAK